MLAFVLAALPLIPLKVDIAHKYIVRIVTVAVNEKDACNVLAGYKREGPAREPHGMSRF
jgi:hypothetical protein